MSSRIKVVSVVVLVVFSALVAFFWKNYSYYNPKLSMWGRDTVAVFEDGRFQIIRLGNKYGLFQFEGTSGKYLVDFLNYGSDFSGENVYLVGQNKEGPEKFIYHVFLPSSGKIDSFSLKSKIPPVFIGKLEQLENEVINAPTGIPHTTRAYPIN